MNDIYTWHSDLYPLVKKRFDMRYADRMDIISNLAEVITQDSVDYRFEGLGGFGEIPVYDGANIAEADQKRSFITTITPKEHALKVSVSYKKAKIDQTNESSRVGSRLADSAYMTVLNEFYRLFGNAFTTIGADGVAWASDHHRINSETDETFSNVIHSALSVSAITAAQTKAASFVTPDGLPFAANYDLLLVSPELEPKAKEICGPDARLMPEKNPDADAPMNAANPVYGMKYMVIGGGGIGFTGKKWAIADSMLLPEILKLVYITQPTVLVANQSNPLFTDYIGYVDFGFGFGDARPIIFSDPA
jgi:hypothetical protein